MSIRAYCMLNSKAVHSFNLWHDEILTNYLSKELDIDVDVLKHATDFLIVPVPLMKKALETLDLDETTYERLSADVNWANKSIYNKHYLVYLCA